MYQILLPKLIDKIISGEISYNGKDFSSSSIDERYQASSKKGQETSNRWA